MIVYMSVGAGAPKASLWKKAWVRAACNISDHLHHNEVKNMRVKFEEYFASLQG